MSALSGSNAGISLVIIDDNKGSLEMLASALKREGLNIFAASDPQEGLDLIHAKHPQIVLTDLVMPDMSGMDILERTIAFDPGIDVVLMTAHYTTETAVEAIRKGAADYLNKPVPIATLRERIGKFVTEAERRRRSVALENEMVAANEFEGIIGRSPLMWDLFSRIRRIAPHYRTVLISGETGSGKDLVASALHRLSPAAPGRFVVLNCSAVVETLFESELFGHVRGSFTGATHDKTGLIEHAHGGTLFLDEIGDMPLATQAKLLRVLQNQEVQRVGSLTAHKVDVRVIAATNHDLRAEIVEKRFREDLYYRLSMVELQMPRLSDRKEDLPLLQRHFISRFAAQYKKAIRGLSHRAQIVLSQHDWPGNVRELENVLGHACMMVTGDVIDINDLPPYLETPSNRAAPTVSNSDALEEQERLLVSRAMEAAGGNQSEAARILRIGRDALRYKLKKHNIGVAGQSRVD